jgi:hypothetical protein
MSEVNRLQILLERLNEEDWICRAYGIHEIK